MIVSQGTSQVVYKIGDDTRVCYTFDENRIIAQILYTESYFRNTIKLLESESKEKDNHIDSLDNKLNSSIFLINQYRLLHDELDDEYNNLNEAYHNVSDDLRKWKTYTKIAGGGIGICLIIITVSIIF